MASRSLEFPVTFKVRGTHSSVSASLLQLALSGCRIRTWRIMPVGENVRIDLLRQNGEILPINGRVSESVHPSPGTYEYMVELEAMNAEQEDVLAREAAMLVRRRHSAA